MKVFYKSAGVIIAATIIVATILSSQYNENQKLKEDLSDLYSRTVTQLYNDVDNVEQYVLDNNEYDMRFLHWISGELHNTHVILYNLYQEVPMTFRYFSDIFGALSSDINILISSKTDKDFIDSEFIEERIVKTCRKIKWAIDLIRQNSNQHKSIGYYKELYNEDSKTHTIVDEELKRYLEEELHIGTS